jgi:hypothetical protein
LTFLRFFALFVGASASGAEERLSLDGELFLGALVEGPSPPGAVSLEAVISSEGAPLPLDFRALPVIKRGRSGLVAFLGKSQLNTFYNALVTPRKAIALAAVEHPVW